MRIGLCVGVALMMIGAVYFAFALLFMVEFGYFPANSDVFAGSVAVGVIGLIIAACDVIREYWGQ